MSDSSRKDVSEKVGETVTSDSQKPITTLISENVSGFSDKISNTIGQSDSNKSTTQEISEKTRSNLPDSKSGNSILESAKKTGNEVTGSKSEGSYVESAKDSLNNALNTVSGKTEGVTKSQ